MTEAAILGALGGAVLLALGVLGWCYRDEIRRQLARARGAGTRTSSDYSGSAPPTPWSLGSEATTAKVRTPVRPFDDGAALEAPTGPRVSSPPIVLHAWADPPPQSRSKRIVPTCRVETSEKALGRVGAALGASGSPGGRAELLVLRKSLSPAGPPPDKPFSFAGF